MRLRLSQRFTIYIGAILAVGIGLLVFNDLHSNMKLLTDIGLSESERLSNGLFEELLHSMSAGGGRAENRAIIERFKLIEGVKEVRVMHGVVIDWQHGMEEDELPVDEYDRAALEGRLVSMISRDGGFSVARFVKPIIARKGCVRCHHTHAGEIIGAISVEISLEKYEAIITDHSWNFIYWGGGILVLTSLCILYVVHDRLLVPIDELKKGAEALASGDLDYRLGINTGDEFEETGSAFDDMAASLSTATSRLEALDEKHSKLMQMAADAILIKDLETDTFTDVNPAAEKLTGYTSTELKAMKTTQLYPRERVEEYRDAFRRLARDGRGYIHEAEVVRKDGSVVPIEIAASVMEIEGRRFMQEIWRDLSERKGFQEIISKHVEELEETVRQRTAELNSSLTALEQAYVKLQDSEQRFVQSAKLISLGEMGAGIAHELNSPLAGILSITEVLLNRTPPDDPNHRLLEKMKDAATRSKYIILDMLTYSRPSRHGFEPMFLNEALRATLCIFISEIKTCSIKIEEDFDLQLPKVFGSKGQIMEVFLNIIKNARDAMDGRGTIYISTWVSREGSGDYAVAEITDTGPGIPDDVMEKIFDPFFSTKEKGGGHNIGLGLSISQSIIKEHNGRIEVQNSPQGGATFRIFVPLNSPDTAEKGASVNARSPAENHVAET
ncbi:MAG: ATP-binding protein [Thermodesulfobacteriota bacterium]